MGCLFRRVHALLMLMVRVDRCGVVDIPVETAMQWMATDGVVVDA